MFFLFTDRQTNITQDLFYSGSEHVCQGKKWRCQPQYTNICVIFPSFAKLQVVFVFQVFTQCYATVF